LAGWVFEPLGLYFGFGYTGICVESYWKLEMGGQEKWLWLNQPRY